MSFLQQSNVFAMTRGLGLVLEPALESARNESLLRLLVCFMFDQKLIKLITRQKYRFDFYRVKVWLPVFPSEPIGCGHNGDAAPVAEAEPAVARSLLKGQGAAGVAEPEAGQGPTVVSFVEADDLFGAGGRECQVKREVVGLRVRVDKETDCKRGQTLILRERIVGRVLWYFFSLH